MKLTEICEACGGYGFSGRGTGYDDVCGECGGLGCFPEKGSLPSDMMVLENVTRVTLVDHSPGGKGLVIEKWHLEEVLLSVQDDGRTLKVFLK